MANVFKTRFPKIRPTSWGKWSINDIKHSDENLQSWNTPDMHAFDFADIKFVAQFAFKICKNNIGWQSTFVLVCISNVFSKEHVSFGELLDFKVLLGAMWYFVWGGRYISWFECGTDQGAPQV